MHSIKPTSNLITKDINDTLKLIKQAVSKSRYSVAWNEAMSFYDKNQNLLSNEDVYRLLYVSFKIICKKFKGRLRVMHRKTHQRSVSNFYEIMINLWSSIDETVYTELFHLDRKFFNMLSHPRQQISLHSIFLFPSASGPPNEPDKIFQLKPDNHFFSKASVEKEIRRYIRQILKLVIASIKGKALQGKRCTSTLRVASEIFDKFESRYFPVEKLEFQILKLQYYELEPQFSLNQTTATGQSSSTPAAPAYHLPISFVYMIYQSSFSARMDRTQHLIRLLKKYLLLAFKHCNISRQNLYVVSCEMIEMMKYFKKKVAEKIGAIGGNNLPYIRISRQTTIDKETQDEFRLKRAPSMNNSDLKLNPSVASKNSESRINGSSISKKKLPKSLQHFSTIIQFIYGTLTDHQNTHLQLKHIINTYLYLELQKNKNNHSSDQIIDNQVIIEVQGRRKKKGRGQREEQDGDRGDRGRGRYGPSGRRVGMEERGEKKSISILQDEGENTNALPSLPSKPTNNKFILKNISNISTINQKRNLLTLTYKHPTPQLLIDCILKETNQVNTLDFLDQESSDSDKDMLYEFEEARRDAIQSLSRKAERSVKKKMDQNFIPMNIAESLSSVINMTNQQKSQQEEKIVLLDSIIQRNVHMLLDLETSIPNSSLAHLPIHKVRSNLAALKLDSYCLQAQKKLVVDGLKMRRDAENAWAQGETNQLSAGWRENLKRQMQHVDEVWNFKLLAEKKAWDYAMKNRNLMKLQDRTPKLSLKQPAATSINSKEFEYIDFKSLKSSAQSIPLSEDLPLPTLPIGTVSLSQNYDHLRRNVGKHQFDNLHETGKKKEEVVREVREREKDREKEKTTPKDRIVEFI